MLSQAGTGFSLSLDDGLERLYLSLFNKLPHTLSGLNNIHHLLSLKSLWVDWDQLGGSSPYVVSFWSCEVWLGGNIQESSLYLTCSSLTQWTWVWVDSGSWWWTGRPGMLAVHGVAKSWTWLSGWTELNWLAGWKLSKGCQLVFHYFLCVIWVWWLGSRSIKVKVTGLLWPSLGSDMVLCLLHSLDWSKSEDQPDSREGKIDSTSGACPSLKRVDIFNPLCEIASKMVLSTYPAVCIFWSSSGPDRSAYTTITPFSGIRNKEG